MAIGIIPDYMIKRFIDGMRFSPYCRPLWRGKSFFQVSDNDKSLLEQSTWLEF